MAGADPDRALVLAQRIAVARSALEGSIRRLEDSCSRLEEIRQQICAGRSRRELLHDSEYARLRARLVSMPVIEQAKGILMAQTGCDAEQVFDMLRRASQHANIPVRDLASEIVCRAAAPGQDERGAQGSIPGRVRDRR